MTHLAPGVLEQIDALELVPGRPIVITDADEVLFAFMDGFVTYLERQGMSFDWSSFAITGNVKDPDGQPVPGEKVREHLGVFFARHTHELQPVPGAADALSDLSGDAQIVVLSNVPTEGVEGRRAALARTGMDYPLVANAGLKGPAVKLIQERARATAIFIDDIPHNHASVAETIPSVWRLHFVADPRLAPMLPPSKDAHRRIDTWTEALPFIRTCLSGAAAPLT